MSPTPFTFLFGPTGSGKTAYALHWASTHNGNLLSCDSRQIFEDFNVVVGKDLPEESTWQIETASGASAWKIPSGQLVFGLDVVDPDKEFSLSDWYTYAQPIVEWHRTNKVPLLIVGGTWPWMEALLAPPASLFVPPVAPWREKAQELSTTQLQQQLQNEFPEYWQHMNDSDRSNRRRLIRAMEVQRFGPLTPPVSLLRLNESQILIRNAEIEVLTATITQRVLERWETGAVEETKLLIEKYPLWDTPAFSATGYPQIRLYINGELTAEEAIASWIASERSYAKRQRTWIKTVEHKYATIAI
jgi:tRNA dimethylallyltransferase